MTDLYVGMALIGLISIGVFFGTKRALRGAPLYLNEMLGTLTILLMVLYIQHLWDSPTLVRLFPFSNLIVVGNWLPVAAAFLAALAWRRIPGRFWRKSLTVVPLVVIGAYSLYHPLRGSPPECGNLWTDGISLQTTRSTCSAASAATLLRLYGIPANEQEMAELCLTRKGTNWQGLYRGLKLKTAETPWDVEVFSCDVEEFLNHPRGPAILTVQLDVDQMVDPAFETDLGWVPGVAHSVVFLGSSTPGTIDMGDPSIGREQWRHEELRILWHGRGIRLVPRTPAQAGPVAIAL